MKKELVSFIAQHIEMDPPVDGFTYSKLENVCAFTGVPIPLGDPVCLLSSVIKPATANLADTFRSASDFVVPEVAACFGESRLLRGNLLITDDGICAPMVSATSAAKAGRPTWCEIFQNLPQNEKAVFILTDESKRRLWLDACVTKVSETLSIFLNCDDISNRIRVHQQTLLDALTIVLDCLSHGFSKQAIRTSLYTHRLGLTAAGLAKTQSLEIACEAYRTTLEFRVATFIGTLKNV